MNMKTPSLRSPPLLALLVLCCLWTLVAPLLLDSADDLCQCGPRCAAYKSENLCARCCTSVMRRSIPLTAYPPEQLVETFSRDSRSRRSGGRTIDNALLAQIVEESRTARKRSSPEWRSVAKREANLAPIEGGSRLLWARNEESVRSAGAVPVEQRRSRRSTFRRQ